MHGHSTPRILPNWVLSVQFVKCQIAVGSPILLEPAFAFATLLGENEGMNAQSQQILQTALALPESERAELAVSLIRSLDTEIDEGVDEAWAAEIRRRI